MTTKQLALDLAELPPGRGQVGDYDEWVARVRPVFEEIAAAGARFVCWQVKEERRLPDPPDPDHDWGRLMSALHREEVVRYDGFSLTKDRSGVRAWRGTRKAQAGLI